MNRQYAKIVYEKWDDSLSLEDAIKAEDYSKSYYLDEMTIGRIDYYDPGVGLFKVSYRQVTPPFEPVVSEHFRLYPNTLCELFTPPVGTGDGSLAVHTYLFQPPGLLESRHELHYDSSGRVVRRVTLSERGERLSEERENYDPSGRWVSTTTLNAAGEATREYRRDDD